MENMQTLMIERLQIFTSASFIFIIFLLVAWKNDYFSSSRRLPESKQALAVKVWSCPFAIFFLLQILLVPASFKLWAFFYPHEESFSPSSLTPEIQGWYTIYAIFVTGIGIGVYYFSLSKGNQEIILGVCALKGSLYKLQDFFIACLSGVLSYPLVIATGQFIALLLMLTYQNAEIEQVAVQQIRMATSSLPLLMTLSVCIIFIVPIIEELLFRGFLQNGLKKYMTSKQAIGLTSLIFALLHFSSLQGWGNVELIASLFVLSCFLGFIYERQQSIWASVSLHAIFNAVNIMLIFYTKRGV
jgi:membrane protease YdiL (CAAX protease family)